MICCPRTNCPTDEAAIELFSQSRRCSSRSEARCGTYFRQVVKAHYLPGSVLAAIVLQRTAPPLFSYFPANTLLVNTGNVETQ
ncbi:hypothetical protein ACNKHU_06735 [Shigella flexneri]